MTTNSPPVCVRFMSVLSIARCQTMAVVVVIAKLPLTDKQRQKEDQNLATAVKLNVAEVSNYLQMKRMKS